MAFAENPNKVRNIVNAQQAQFRELYHRLVVGLPGVHWSGEKVEVSFTLRYNYGFVAEWVLVCVGWNGSKEVVRKWSYRTLRGPTGFEEESGSMRGSTA
jgi:hypothetical protein